jgi:CheY-like chemotaxis protein
VCDTGRVLSEHESQSLFNRFAQASPKTHIEYGGSGLGLFIARQIVELMGGQIGIKHEQDAGCTFAFYVETQRAAAAKDELLTEIDTLKINLTHHPVTPPMSMISDTPSNLTPLERSASPFSGVSNIFAQPALSAQTGGVVIEVDASNKRKFDKTVELASKKKPLLVSPSLPVPTTAEPLKQAAKVLVVEDNLINQKVVCKQLKNRGYIVHAANHGGEAIAALHSAWHSTRTGPYQVEEGVMANQAKGTYFDIILCDLEMPVMDGIACAKEVRRLENEGKLPGHVPMITVTANARSKHVESALEAGMVSSDTLFVPLVTKLDK